MKTIVIASGKGGTGKTTLTALFARAASARGPVVVADCDVEASNLPIALHAEAIATETFAGRETAEVEASRCTGCGSCVAACRFDAVRVRDGRALVDEWACEGCGACEAVCPEGAIAMGPRDGGAVAAADAATGPMLFGQLEPGQDLSGKLVTEVRRRAKDAATGADVLVLVDGPPGVGCPVIASVTNADLLVAVTEPSVSGEHDLRRLVLLARKLGVPVVAVLNKADLSAPGAARIRTACERHGVELVGEVPFDPAMAAALERLAEGEEPAQAAAAVRRATEIFTRIAGPAGAAGEGA